MLPTIVFLVAAATAAPGLLGQRGRIELRGTVGDAPVRMTLERNGQRLSGSYLYEKHFQAIWLVGTIADGQVRLGAGFGKPDLHGEQFTGALVGEGGDRIEGTWTAARGRRTLPFALGPDPDPHSVPSSWVTFSAEGCPFTFPHPPGWQASTKGRHVWLRTGAREDSVWADWGRHPQQPPSMSVYEYRRGRWYLAADASNGESPVHFKRRGDLKISNDQRLCRMYGEHGYEGLADCWATLVVGPDFWFAMGSENSSNEAAIGVILEHLRRPE